MEEVKRTFKQNRAMHKYFQEVSGLLNEHGVSVPLFLEKFELDFSKGMVKDIFRAIGKQKFGKESTADLTSKELQDIWEEFNRAIGLEGIHLEFPCKELQYQEENL